MDLDDDPELPGGGTLLASLFVVDGGFHVLVLEVEAPCRVQGCLAGPRHDLAGLVQGPAGLVGRSPVVVEELLGGEVAGEPDDAADRGFGFEREGGSARGRCELGDG